MVDLNISEWLNLALRWLHLIAGITWIGSSFYFVWLDSHLRPSPRSKEGVGGELWAVHGGGFYHNQKYVVAPAELPDDLHWFKWEAYTTWISGFFLLCMIYYLGADLFLIDRDKADLEEWQASAIGIAFLAAGWLVYHVLCNTALGRNNQAFGIVWFALLTLATFALTQIFSGRGAFIHMGALIGTVMAANVFFVIIPNQKKTVAAMIAGEKPDPILGERAKQRSVHNSYMTMPVLFSMISIHYPMTFGHPYNWLVLAGLGVVGWTIRYFYIQRHMGNTNYWTAAAAVVGFLVVLVFASMTGNRSRAALSDDQNVPFATVRSIFDKHCVGCHAVEPTVADFAEVPPEISFENDIDIQTFAPLIYEQVVEFDVMPLFIDDDAPVMTLEERAPRRRMDRPRREAGVAGYSGAAPNIAKISSPVMVLVSSAKA